MTQALLPNFNRWLKDRGLQPATLLALRKESILNDTTLRLLTESDLEALKKQYKISLGQFALLRNARDDLTSAVAEDFEVIELTDVPEDTSHDRRSTGGRPDSAGRGQQVCNCHMSVQRVYIVIGVQNKYYSICIYSVYIMYTLKCLISIIICSARNRT